MKTKTETIHLILISLFTTLLIGQFLIGPLSIFHTYIYYFVKYSAFFTEGSSVYIYIYIYIYMYVYMYIYEGVLLDETPKNNIPTRA